MTHLIDLITKRPTTKTLHLICISLFPQRPTDNRGGPRDTLHYSKTKRSPTKICIPYLFVMRMEVKQRDPLSPYLFVICMEVLSQMLHKATAAGFIKLHPKCAKLNISYLCFADGLLIFSEAFLDTLHGLKRVMAEFQSLSALGVS